MPRYIYIPIALAGVMLVVGCTPFGTPGGSSDSPSAANSSDMKNARAAQECLLIARNLDRNGYGDDAIGEYERAREFDPSLKGVAKRLAVLYDRHGNDRKAMEEYKTAQNESPDDPEVLNDLGYFYIVRNDGPEAEPYLHLAVTKDPHMDRAWVNLGTAYAEDRKYHDAYGAYVRVLTPAEAWYNLGMIQTMQGDYKEATRSLKKAQENDPNSQQTRSGIEILNKKMAADPALRPSTMPSK